LIGSLEKAFFFLCMQAGNTEYALEAFNDLCQLDEGGSCCGFGFTNTDFPGQCEFAGGAGFWFAVILGSCALMAFLSVICSTLEIPRRFERCKQNRQSKRYEAKQRRAREEVDREARERQAREAEALEQKRRDIAAREAEVKRQEEAQQLAAREQQLAAREQQAAATTTVAVEEGAPTAINEVRAVPVPVAQVTPAGGGAEAPESAALEYRP
jgi:hypothetical protein